MIKLADINVVFALLVDGHEHHPAAWAWWEKQPEDGVAWALPVKLGILRLLSNARTMQGEPLEPEKALDAWEKFANDPRTREAEFPSIAHESVLRRLVSGRKTTPNLWTDAWLAALAESLTIGLTSFDAGFRSFGLRNFEQLQG